MGLLLPSGIILYYCFWAVGGGGGYVHFFSTKGALSNSTAFWGCVMGYVFLALKARKRWVV
jgi:hypothetical protein